MGNHGPGTMWWWRVLGGCPYPPNLAGGCAYSPVPVLLHTIAVPLVSLPVACVLEWPRSLRGTLQDPEAMPQARLEVALIHLVRAVPGEGHKQLARAPRGSDRRKGTSPALAEGHLLTDAIAIHAACPPVALVAVELVLRGLGHQMDAEATSVASGS